MRLQILDYQQRRGVSRHAAAWGELSCWHRGRHAGASRCGIHGRRRCRERSRGGRPGQGAPRSRRSGRGSRCGGRRPDSPRGARRPVRVTPCQAGTPCAILAGGPGSHPDAVPREERLEAPPFLGGGSGALARASRRTGGTTMRAKWLVSVILVSLVALAGLDPALAQTKWKGVATQPAPPAVRAVDVAGRGARQAHERPGQAGRRQPARAGPHRLRAGARHPRRPRGRRRRASSTYVAGDVPAVEGVDLPGLFPDFDTSVKAHVAFMPAIKKHEDKLGRRRPGRATCGPSQYIFSRKPVRSPADLKGLKVRVYGTAQTEFARALGHGARLASRSPRRTRRSSAGTVDAAITGTYPGFALKFYEVTQVPGRRQPRSRRRHLRGEQADVGQALARLRAPLTKLGEEFSERGWEIGRRTTAGRHRQEQGEGHGDHPDHARPWRPPSGTSVTKVVLPSWIKRAGPDAKATFNQYLAPHSGITLP